MIGVIDSSGKLVIKRGSKMKEQVCGAITASPCSDRCPHFGEPERTSVAMSDTKLKICRGRTLAFTQFTDERK